MLESLRGIRDSILESQDYELTHVLGMSMFKAGPILEIESMRAIFQKKGKKMFKKDKKGQNIWKFAQKWTKFQNVLKKARWLHAINSRNKLLEKTM